MASPIEEMSYSFDEQYIRENDLQCPICLRFLEDPIQTPECGHLFCQRCIATWIEQGNERCPLDNGPVDTARILNMPVDQRAKRAVLATSVTCNYCNSRMPFSDWRDHIEQCQKVTVKCPFEKYGCKERIARGQLATHEEIATKEHLTLACQMIDRMEERAPTQLENSQSELATTSLRVNPPQVEEQIEETSIHNILSGIRPNFPSLQQFRTFFASKKIGPKPAGI